VSEGVLEGATAIVGGGRPARTSLPGEGDAVKALDRQVSDPGDKTPSQSVLAESIQYRSASVTPTLVHKQQTQNSPPTQFQNSPPIQYTLFYNRGYRMAFNVRL